MKLRSSRVAVGPLPEKSRGWAIGAIGLALAAYVAGVFVNTGSAQDFPQAWLDGAQVWQTAGCGDCHGTYGEGYPEVEEAAIGPNLRETALTREQLLETIRCGRPGTPMPYHDPLAYNETACFGLPLGEEVEGTEQGVELTPEQIENLATYLAEAVKGAGPVGLDACAIYHGGNRDHSVCRWYR